MLVGGVGVALLRLLVGCCCCPEFLSMFVFGAGFAPIVFALLSLSGCVFE